MATNQIIVTNYCKYRIVIVAGKEKIAAMETRRIIGKTFREHPLHPLLGTPAMIGISREFPIFISLIHVELHTKMYS